MLLSQTEAKNFIKAQKPFFLGKAKKIGYICPNCGNGSGSSGDGIVLDKNNPLKVHYKCFVCGIYYDVIDLVGSYYGIANDNFSAKFKKALEVYNITLQDEYFQAKGNNFSFIGQNLEDFFKIAQKNNDFKYLKSRGISEPIQRRFKIGFIPNWRSPEAEKLLSKGDKYQKIPHSPRCIIPTGENSYLARDTRVEIPKSQDRYKKQKHGKAQIFNLEAIKSQREIFVTEGEIDALSIEEVGGTAVGLGSTTKVMDFARYVEENYSGQVFILCLDNDKAGKTAQKQLSDELKKKEIPFIDGMEYAQSIAKDPNDALILGRENFKNIISALKVKAKEKTKNCDLSQYKATEILDYFRKIEQQPKYLEVKTGFNELDEKLQGGLHEGLYVIGAISGLGKTTFALQVADQISAKSTDVIFFSLEMGKLEVTAKSISRNTYLQVEELEEEAKNKLAKNTAQIINNTRYRDYDDEERNIINKAIEKYSLQARNLYIYEGRHKGNRLTVKEIKEIVRKHKNTNGRTPIVFVDYLQILSPENYRGNDKQNVDEAIFELKELSRELKTAVIVISSFNRDSYLEPVNMTSFKESGAVEYSSDVLLGLQYAGMDYETGENEKQRVQRIRSLMRDISEKKEQKKGIKVELKCLKNRNGFQFTVEFNQYPAYNYFEEASYRKDAINGRKVKNTI